MASTRGKLVDKNRFSKTYPFVRKPTRHVYMSDKLIAIELGQLTFTNSSSEILTYDKAFDSSDYQVVAMARDDNVNVWVDPSGTGTNQVTVGASCTFTGAVDVIAIRIEE